MTDEIIEQNVENKDKKIKMAYIDVNYVVNQSKDIQELQAETMQKKQRTSNLAF